MRASRYQFTQQIDIVIKPNLVSRFGSLHNRHFLLLLLLLITVILKGNVSGLDAYSPRYIKTNCLYSFCLELGQIHPLERSLIGIRCRKVGGKSVVYVRPSLAL